MSPATLTRALARRIPTDEAATRAPRLIERGMASPAFALLHALESGDMEPLLAHEGIAVAKAARELLTARGWRSDDCRALVALVSEHAFLTGDERTVVETPRLETRQRPAGTWA